MSKKRFLISALAIAACSAGALTLPATPAWADADEDNSLPPLVMIVFDTSGSMDYCFETEAGGPPQDADGNELEIYCNQFTAQIKKQHFKEDRPVYEGIMSSILPEGDHDYRHSSISTKLNEDDEEDSEFAYTNDTCEGAWSAPWKDCHTEPILGYKGIRNECVHTRLTNAISLIAGSPKTLEGRNMLVKANEQKPFRAVYKCDGSSCGYDYVGGNSNDATDPRYSTKPYLFDCEQNNPDRTCDPISLANGHHCYENDYYYCVSAIQTFGDKEHKDLKAYQSGNIYDHEGYYKYVLNNIPAADLANAYNDDGIIQSYASRVKFGFAGFDYTGNDEYLYDGNGALKGKEYKKRGLGISNNNVKSQAPLLYPTVEDDPERIIERNNAVAYSVRGYWAGGGTPIGPALADIKYILTKDEECQRQWVNKPGGGTEKIPDAKFGCRDKAVILITDGAPSSAYGVTDTGAEGQGARVWEDAERLFNEGIKVYVVGYSMRQLNPRRQPSVTNEIKETRDGEEVVVDYETLVNKCEGSYSTNIDCVGNVSSTYYDDAKNLDKFAGDILNRIAWKGGTCVNPETGELIKPDDESGYLKLLDQCKGAKDNFDACQCFYNADSREKLNTALVTVLTDMLSGFYSKTKVVTTTAIGYHRNHVGIINPDPKATNRLKLLAGFYNIYSGYNIGNGAMTQAKLERTAVVCDPKTGEFVPKDDQKIDFAEKLKARVKDCTNAKSIKGFNDFPDNDCVERRMIFSGKYSTFYQYPPISKFQPNTDAKVDDIDDSYPKKTKNIESIGILPRSLIADVSFADIYGLTNTEVFNGEVKACSDLKHYGYDANQYIPADYTKINYVLSPYECVTNVDCGMDGKHTMHCDLGRCISYKKYEEYREDNSCDGLGYGYDASKKKIGPFDQYRTASKYVCIDRLLREVKPECNAHHCGKGAPKSCEGCNKPGEVCHAGQCVAGTALDGTDVRQFIASQPLGAIEYASPLVVPPPNKMFNSEDYIQFHVDYMTRDTLLLAGANDAMLHAFILGDNMQSNQYKGCGPDGKCSKEIYNLPHAFRGSEVKKYLPDLNLKYGGQDPSAEDKEGEELWAFVPKLMLPKLSELVKNFKTTGKTSFSGVNSTPVYADVHLPSGVTINGDYWRTVVVGGMGSGGRGYYALDVTDPGNPFVLWEVDNDPVLSSSNFVSYVACEALGWSTSYCSSMGTHMLGYSYPEPVITNMVIGDKVEPVVILAGGRDDDHKSVFGKDKLSKPGHVMYILRLFPQTSYENLFVKSFYFNEVLVGTPTVFPNGFNTVAQRIYVGDEKGSLYAINVTGGNVDKWDADYSDSAISMLKPYTKSVPKPIFKVANAGKMSFAPAVNLYATYMNEPVIQLAFGTGSNDQIVTPSGEVNYVASFLDVPQSNGKYMLNNVPGGADIEDVFNFTPTLYYFGNTISYQPSGSGIKKEERINAREHMTASPITYNFTTYFATYDGGASSSATKCMTGHANLYRFGNVKEPMRLGRLTENVQNIYDNDLFVKNGTKVGEGYRIELGSGQIYGLDVSEQLFCQLDSDDPKDKFKGKTWAPQLLFLTNSKNPTDLEKSNGTYDNTTSKASGINLDAIKSDVTFSTWASVYE